MMDEWNVGDPPDWGDSVGVPDIPYMGYIDDEDDDDDDFQRRPRKSRAETIVDEAWDLRMQGRFRDAVGVVSAAIDMDDQLANAYNVRAIAWQDLRQFEYALHDFDRALALYDSQVIKNNKAGLLEMMSNDEKYRTGNMVKALELINEALKLTDIKDARISYLRRKGQILDMMGRRVDSRICYLLASESYDLVEEAERQAKILEDPNETFICIAGTKYFEQEKPLSEGTVVTLVRMGENEHDPDAILVQLEGRNVGYVANSSFTLIDGAKGASEIKDIMKENQKAKILFKYFDEYLVAKLI